MLYLVEHFFSFQGEGLYSGRPSIFLRFGGCNLNCIGFGSTTVSAKDNNKNLIGCDSLKAVDKEHFAHTWKEVNSDDLITIIEQYEDNLNYTPDVVITGGEPLTNINNIYFIELLEYIKSKNSNVTIETNATIKIDFEKYTIYKYPTYSMSVKLSNSQEDYEKRVNPDAIGAIINSAKDYYFKFTVDSMYVKEYKNIEIRGITMKYSNVQIYCMPLGSSIEELKVHEDSIVEFCKQYGYTYSDRTHIRIYNKRDGV